MMGLKADLEGQSNEFKSGDRVVSTNLPKKTQSKLFIHRFEKVGLRVGSDLDKNLIGQQDPRSDIYCIPSSQVLISLSLIILAAISHTSKRSSTLSTA